MGALGCVTCTLSGEKLLGEFLGGCGVLKGAGDQRKTDMFTQGALIQALDDLDDTALIGEAPQQVRAACHAIRCTDLEAAPDFVNCHVTHSPR
jgi:hypothetical protein